MLDSKLTHIIMLSGGVGSFFAAKRVIENIKKPKEKVVLLFADTFIEDEDLYRFLKDIENYFNLYITVLSDGRTPWQLFFEKKFLGNSQVDLCSRILKRDLLRTYIRNNYKPEECVVYLGIDWTEEHRIIRAAKFNQPYIYKAPLCDKPLLQKEQLLDLLENECKIRRPKLYCLGFKHNNCGGFCIKSGQAQFELLLRKLPERYKYHEDMEQKIIKHIGKKVTILRRRKRNIMTYRISLKEFREHLESKGNFDKNEWGGCGCAI